jgi:prepilin-type N-terminal cleavage/methylation domain-containing protein
MKNKKGFTLIELLVSLLISSILILMIGVLSSTANRSFSKANDQQGVYSDLSFGFKLLQTKVRSASTLAAGNKPAPWVSGEHFLINTSGVFGLCEFNFNTNQCQAGGSDRALVYSDSASQQVILRIPPPDSITVSFPSLSATAVTIMISGTKDDVPFSIQSTAARRNL